MEVEEVPLLHKLTVALAKLPGASEELRPLLEEALKEHRRLNSQLRKISRIGDRYQEQLRHLNQELSQTNGRLSQALNEVKTLQGCIPICARCKRVRDDTGYWDQVEAYLGKHSDAVFSHGVCPDCARLLFPEVRPAVGEREPEPAVPEPRAFTEGRDLEDRLERLRTDPALRDNPLTAELAELARRHLHLLRRMGKIAHISDGFQHQLKRTNRALAEASYTDLLTGLPNRRAMMDRVNGELDRSARGGPPPSVLMVDVDHFKNINDTYGHEMGDRVLQTLAGAMLGAIRGYDTCARWGGEEFLVLLPETGLAAAQTVGNKLLEAVSTMDPLGDGQGPSVTVSMGAAVYREGESLAALVRRADWGLYQAKRLGRNQVVAAPDLA